MGKIRAGDRAVRRPSPCDLAWAAGFYEGEGTVNLGDDPSLQLSIVQNNPEPLQRFYQLFGGRKPYIYRPAKGNRRDCWRWYASGVRARGIALTLYSLLSHSKRRRIYDAFTMKHKPMSGDWNGNTEVKDQTFNDLDHLELT